MQNKRVPRFDATILGAASLFALAMGGAAAQSTAAADTPTRPSVIREGTSVADLVGVWRSADKAVKLDLRADGTYKRSVKGRSKVAHGDYKRDGLLLRLRDDSGLQTDVSILDGDLEMAGHRLARS